jgi:hypothetical protein
MSLRGTPTVVLLLPPSTTIVTITAAILATTASAPAETAMMTLRRFPRRRCPSGPDATAEEGAVGGPVHARDLMISGAT